LSIALFELFLDSPHSLEYFLDHLPVSWGSLVSEDSIKTIFKVGVLIKIGCCSGWFADDVRECSVVALHYADATAAAQALIAAQFATVLQVVWRAIWQFLDAILLAAWWLGIGWLLRPDHRRRLSRLSLALAAAAKVGAAANVSGLHLVRDVLLGVLFTLWTAWWISLLAVFCTPIANSFHHFQFLTEVRLPAGPSTTSPSRGDQRHAAPLRGGGLIKMLCTSPHAPATDA
jgi:hypothetical protein